MWWMSPRLSILPRCPHWKAALWDTAVNASYPPYPHIHPLLFWQQSIQIWISLGDAIFLILFPRGLSEAGSTALNLGVGFSKMTDQDWAHDSSWSNERCYYRFGETLEISEPRLFCPRCYLPKSACNGSAPSRLPLGEGDGQPHDLSIISLTSTPYRYLDIILPSVSLLAPHTIPHNTAGWGFHGISPTTFFPWPSPYVSSIVPWF